MNRIRPASTTVSLLLCALTVACSNSPATNGQLAANNSGPSANVNGPTVTSEPHTKPPNNNANAGTGRPSATSSKATESNAQAATIPEKMIGTGGNDLYLFTRIRGALTNDEALKDTEIVVSVNDGVVVLTGTMANEAKKSRAADVVRGIDGVKEVRNELKTK